VQGVSSGCQSPSSHPHAKCFLDSSHPLAMRTHPRGWRCERIAAGRAESGHARPGRFATVYGVGKAQGPKEGGGKLPPKNTGLSLIPVSRRRSSPGASIASSFRSLRHSLRRRPSRCRNLYSRRSLVLRRPVRSPRRLVLRRLVRRSRRSLGNRRNRRTLSQAVRLGRTRMLRRFPCRRHRTSPS
jgi:hypothetical protein